MQWYRCLECGRSFQSARRGKRVRDTLWGAYVGGKQTLKQLANASGRSHVWVRRRLDAVEVGIPAIDPQQTVLIVDTTFWGRSYGVCVFFSKELKRAMFIIEMRTDGGSYLDEFTALKEMGASLGRAVVCGAIAAVAVLF